MRNVINIIAKTTGSALLLLGFMGTSVSAAGTASAQFLKLGAGARAAGMGGAFSSVANDATATYWNPAGLAQIDSAQVSMMHNDWMVDTQYQFAAAALPLGNSALGLSLIRMDYGSFEGYDASDTKTTGFDAGSMAGGLTVSHEVSEGFFLGATVKFIQEKIEDESASGIAGDFGCLVNNETLNFSASYHHAGSAVKFVDEEEDLPSTLRLGISGKAFDEKMLLSLDYALPSDNDGKLHAGMEYLMFSRFALRAGYQATPGNQIDVEGVTNVTGGMGVGFGRWELDYAFVPFGDLGQTHQVSLLFKFSSQN